MSLSTALLRRALHSRATFSLSFSSSSSSSSYAAASSDEDDDVVSRAVSVIKDQRARARWSSLKSLFPKGFTPTQITRILIKIWNNPRLAHSFFNFAARKSPYPLPSQCYAPVIHIVGRAHLKARAQTLIENALQASRLEDRKVENKTDSPVQKESPQMPKIFRELVETYTVCHSIPLVFDLLIEALLERRKLDTCIEIVRLLRDRSKFRPQVSTCNALISKACRMKGGHFGYDLYKELFHSNHYDDVDDELAYRTVRQRAFYQKFAPNVTTFNSLICAFRRDGLLDMVEEMWIEMAKLNIAPKDSSYAILMAAYCCEGEIDKAQNVWEDLKDKGLKPDVSCYTTLICAYCRVGDIEKAEELYREMGLAGLRGSELIYQELVNAYCIMKDVDSAMLVYKDMCVKGFRTLDSTLNTMVGLLCEKRSVLVAFEFFMTVMAQNTKFVARESSFRMLIKGLCKEGKMDEALQLQAKMVGKGFKPDSDIYEAFVDGYMKLGKPDMVQKLREEMEEFITPD